MAVRMAAILAALGLATPAYAASARVDRFPGTYTNEEQVYFDKDAKRPPPAWFSLKIAATAEGLAIAEPDAFGAVHSPPHVLKRSHEGATTVLDYGSCQRLYRNDGEALVASGVRGTCRAPATMTRIDASGIELTFPDGRTTQLRRARGVTCWGASLKAARKPDGSEDWYGASALRLHDQGGRVAFGGGATGAPPVVLRMRNVVWPSGPNKPSLVLYAHTPDQPDHAVSYSWADPGAKRIGINLRWMQASCSVDGI